MSNNYPYDQSNMSNTMGNSYKDPPRNQSTPMQPYSRNMQTPNMQTPPLSPLAGSLPVPPSGISIQNPTIPLSSLQGTVPRTDIPITHLAGTIPQMPGGVETPTTVQSPYYTSGFLKHFIGKNVRVEFVLGTNGSLTDRMGTLLEVGASYIVIQPLLTDDLLMCDLYSIRFVTIFG